MARIIFSPLIASASGKAADAVFSSWKGRGYVRKRVVPHNPKSDAQKVVREAMGRLPPLWRSFDLHVHAAQNLYGTAYRESGWNWYAHANRVGEQDNKAALFTPPNTTIERPATITLSDESGGVCKVDWTGGTRGTTFMIYVIARKITEDEVETAFAVPSASTVLVSAGTVNITLEASKEYSIGVCVDDQTARNMSEALQDEIALGA